MQVLQTKDDLWETPLGIQNDKGMIDCCFTTKNRVIPNSFQFLQIYLVCESIGH